MRRQIFFSRMYDRWIGFVYNEMTLVETIDLGHLSTRDACPWEEEVANV